MKRTLRNLLLAALALLAIPTPAQAQLPFFPGAEGFGGTFTGSAPAGGWFSNATIYHVTTTQDLLDSGTGKPAMGTLRGAFYDYTNPNSPKQQISNRVVVFDVGGTFQLTQGALDIKTANNVYIAGHTAPSPVTVYGHTTQISKSNNTMTSNVALRYMTFRKGTGDGADAFTFSGGNGDGDTVATNMILDHVSASWSEDEVISVTNNNTNVTVQYSMMTDSLTSGHQYGSLIRPKVSAQVSYHHNLYGNDKSRNPRPGTYNNEQLDLDFRNNVIYNWSDRAGYSGGASEDATEYINLNYVGNYAIAGPATPGGTSSTTAFTMDVGSFYNLATNSLLAEPKDYIALQIYQSGNAVDSDHDAVRNGTDTGWGMFRASSGAVNVPYPDFNYGPNSAHPAKAATPFAYTAVTTESAAAAYDRVLQYVGNSWWSRDAIDARIIGNVQNNTQPVGGIPATAPVPAELAAVLNAPLVARPAGWDTDSDGMPDAWEFAHGLNPNSAADNKLDFDNDGYVNVIEYINEVGEFPAPAPIHFNGVTNSLYSQILNWKTNDSVTSGSNWQPSKYDVAVVNNGTVLVNAVGQHAGTLNVAPTAGNNATLNVTAGWIDVAAQLNVGAAGTAVVNHSAGAVVADAITLGGAVGASGAYNLSGSATLVVGTLSKGANGGAFAMTGGTLTAGTVAFSFTNNGGTIAPGASPGLMNVTGDLTNASGTLRMELAGTADGQYDKIAVTGALHAGGILDIDLLGAFTPAAGDAFNLFDFTSSSGGFQLMLPALPPGLNWNSSNLLNTGVLSVTSALGPNADFNGDNLVDGADLLVWQRGVGLIGQSTNANGDADRNGSINADDLQIVRSQFGTNPNAAPTNAAVPEPAAATLALLAALACASACRQRP